MSDARWLGDVFRSGPTDDGVLDRIRDVVRKHEGLEYSLEKAREYSRACKEKLKALEESESRTSLAMLADYVVGGVCCGSTVRAYSAAGVCRAIGGATGPG